MKRFALLAALLIGGAGTLAVAAEALRVTPLPITNAAWEKPFPAFRIIGNLYYVGTTDLGCFVIATGEGLILVNSGEASSGAMIADSIQKLGFQVSDIKMILATHAHRDHVGALAELKQRSGAPFYMHEADVAMVESGGNVDYRRPQGRGVIFAPVKVDRALKHGDRIRLGTTELIVHHHPGHTKGSTSFEFTTEEAGRRYNVVIANMASVNEGTRLLDSPGYPEIVQDYARTLASQKALRPDVWVASHGGQFGLAEKYRPGPYDPARFVDPAGWQAAVAGYEQAYLKRLEEERQGLRR